MSGSEAGLKKYIIKKIMRLKRNPNDLHAANQLTRTMMNLTQGVDLAWIETRHFREELANDDCDVQDAMNVLENGSIREPPEYCPKHGDNKYRVHGKTIDGDDAVVVEILLLGEPDDEELLGVKLITFWKK